MKTWMLRVTEDELKCLINDTAGKIYSDPTPENSARLHDLVKLFNKDTPEIDGDPRPEDKSLGQSVVTSDPDRYSKAPEGWS
jgi:hypothetical protein